MVPRCPTLPIGTIEIRAQSGKSAMPRVSVSQHRDRSRHRSENIILRGNKIQRKIGKSVFRKEKNNELLSARFAAGLIIGRILSDFVPLL